MNEIHKCAAEASVAPSRGFAVVDLKRAAALNHAIGAPTARRSRPMSGDAATEADTRQTSNSFKAMMGVKTPS
jgi:hypothetical protein